MKDFFKFIVAAILAIALIYLLIASFMWRWNNPKANSLTVLTHPWQVLTFTKNPSFQE